MEIATVSSRQEDSAGDRGAIEKSAAVTPDEVVDTQAIDFGFWLRIWQRYWQRRWLRFWAWYSKRTRAGERWLLLSWDSGQDEFKRYFNENACRFGENLKKHVPKKLERRLEEFIDGGGEPFLIIRGVFSRRYPQLSLTAALESDPANPLRKIAEKRAERLLDKKRFNLIASGLIAATGTELRFKQPTQNVYRDYITSVETEKNQFVEGGDLSLYYRTATPEQPPERTGGAGMAARVILFACVENPIADPIYLIRADEVVARLSDEERKLLKDDSYYFFDNWNPKSLVTARINKAKHVLYNEHVAAEPWLSFDPNRLWAEFDKTTAAHRLAIVALMESIRHVGASSARKIVLNRGDALIVDNYRALTCRHERGHFYFDPWPLGRPRLRWLRVYYGFPKQ